MASNPQSNTSLTWTPSYKEDETKVGFLDLPRELRDLVYEFAFRIPGAILVYSRDPFAVRPVARAMNIRHGGDGPIEPQPLSTGQIPVALWRTCRQLRAESSPVFYGTNVLSFWALGNIDVGLANMCLVRHVVTEASPRGIFDKSLEHVSYCWKRRFWPEILRNSDAIMKQFPNLETLTFSLKPPRGEIWTPAFFAVANKTREQRIDLVATWMSQRCSWEDDRLRQILHLEMVPSPGLSRREYAGSRFIPEDDDVWDCTEFADAFEQMKSSIQLDASVDASIG
ncbi:uncharacterized protein ALTATR162_LOCUS9553 [Alternaria atra]|uniref:Uncharacterized protein n=1 Tax=Alternaria atra TaxID=119953 RepID=A0A8J2IEG8_9PLEO|nr:uncharacterized protein ALTATR162_LOCUS9553 [Alternaria atra]CAG5181020.1 unnamed protein product [Alternaria atra]